MKRKLLFGFVFITIGLIALGLNPKYHLRERVWFRLSSLDSIVSQIAVANSLEWMHGFGIGGVGTSYQLLRYEQLQARASSKDLVQWTSHTNAVVRCYAFEALVERKDSSIHEIFLEHLNDTAFLIESGGCIITAKSVRQFFVSSYQHLNASERDHSELLWLDSLALAFKYDQIDSATRVKLFGVEDTTNGTIYSKKEPIITEDQFLTFTKEREAAL